MVPTAGKLAALVTKTLRVVGKARASGRTLSHLVGCWTWFAMLNRPLLSVLDRVFVFIERAKGGVETTVLPIRTRPLSLFIIVAGNLPLGVLSFDG